MSMQHTGVWILAEQKAGRIQRISHELITRGLELAGKRNVPLSAMVFGYGIEQADIDDLIARGVDRVVAVEAPELAHFLVEPYAACMTSIIEQYRPEIILAGATSLGRTLMPYVAIRVFAGLTADCTGLDIEPDTGNLLQTRPAIGGNILATIKTPNHRPQMATVRPHSTPVAQPQSGRKGEILRLAAPQATLKGRVIRKDFVADTSEHTLQDAEIVVVAGRGIKKAENVALVQELANALGAALGGTRDVVDRGWLSYPHQIGLSGKTISPKLYIGVGVSGSIQHLAGMQTAKTIVAINKDPDAQIFRVADYGIVGDLFEVVPALIKKLKTGQTHGK
jgi:electron transfer flavoprotein alpha subunit